MGLNDLLKIAIERGGSDVFIIPGSPVMVKVQGNLQTLNDQRMLPADTKALIGEAYALAGRQQEALSEREGDDDFSFSFGI